MASILVTGSFLAGSIISLLIPIAVLIGLSVWHTRAIIRVPRDPAKTAAAAAGAQEAEGRPDAPAS